MLKIPKSTASVRDAFILVQTCFDDPNGEKLDPGVATLTSKTHTDRTVNESEITMLLRQT